MVGQTGYITGRVRVVGVDGVVADSTMTLRINESANEYDVSFELDGEVINLVFAADETAGFYQFEALNSTLAIGDFNVSGDAQFTYSNADDTFKFLADDMQAQLGVAGTGVSVSNINASASTPQMMRLIRSVRAVSPLRVQAVLRFRESMIWD